MKQITKILGLGMLLLFLASMQLSAQKCKFAYDKKDPITGEQSKGVQFTIQRTWALAICRLGDTYFISMAMTGAGNNREIITTENTIILKLANGELITINAKEEYVPAAQATQYGVVTQWRAEYNISEEDLQKMANSPLTYVRMQIGARTFDQEIDTKKGQDFQNKSKCILQ